ncbi:MAG TPA: ABC transporter ATP-binding protein [Polyangiaceae bacterium]
MDEPVLASSHQNSLREGEKRSILSYYVTFLGRVLRGPRLFLFVLASAMHAVGHGLVALVAGALAVGLAGSLSAIGAHVPHRIPVLPWTADSLSWSVVGLVVLFVKALTGVYATYVQGRAAAEVGASLRLELLDALLAVHRLRRPRQDDQGSRLSTTAAGVAALTDRVREVELGLKEGFLGGARALAQLLPLGAVMVAISPRAAMTAALVLGGFGVVLGRLRRGYRKASTLAAAERARLLEAADESVRHAELWVAYGAESKARTTVSALGRSIAMDAARLDARAVALSGANEVLGALALVLALGASRLGWLGGAQDGATLLGFAVTFFLAYRPLRELAEARLALDRASAAFDGLAGFLATASEVGAEPARAGGQAPRERAWTMEPLELRGVRLSRGSCEPVSLRVEAGAIAVVVGPTGVGKTTLLRTLLGFESSAGGQVLFGGLSLGDAAAGPIGRPFAWVPQDAPLIADTLQANVGLGALDAAGDDAMGALDPMGAGHLGKALEGGRLGAGGRAVSGGERQWIALARALATRQPVLLLDEPTSGLDAEAQRRVLEAIARLRGKRTVVLVTHRTEPLALADVVLRLKPAGGAREAA